MPDTKDVPQFWASSFGLGTSATEFLILCGRLAVDLDEENNPSAGKTEPSCILHLSPQAAGDLVAILQRAIGDWQAMNGAEGTITPFQRTGVVE